MPTMTQATLPPTPEIASGLEEHRRDLTGYCYRMLGSPFEAEDAVQETMLRAWRGYQGFEGRSALRSWLYRIATNVCLDMVKGRAHRALPMDIGPSRHLDNITMGILPEATWIEPIPDTTLTMEADPAHVAVTRESVRLAFITALQHLPPRQRAVLILFEVMRWSAAEVAQLLDTTAASVNSALQRARATLQARGISADTPGPPLDQAQRELLARYVRAFESYDFPTLTSLIREDAIQSMPPYEMWLTGRDDIFAWWVGPGKGCQDSRLLPTVGANGVAAFGQYKPAPSGGRDPWSVMVVELRGDRIAELTFFLSTERLFPLFGLPMHLGGDPDWDPFAILQRQP